MSATSKSPDPPASPVALATQNESSSKTHQQPSRDNSSIWATQSRPSTRRIGSIQLGAFLQNVEDRGTDFSDAQDLSRQLTAFNEQRERTRAVANSPEQVKIWIEARDELLSDCQIYHRAKYEELMRTVKDKCEGILRMKRLKSVPILHQELSVRKKDVGSTKKKANRQMRALRMENNVQDVSTAKRKLYQRMVDIVGLRILVYFPDDVTRVVQLIEDSKELDVLDSVVSYSRSREDRRKQDKSEQLGGAQTNYTAGAFGERSMPTSEIIRRWKNAGYRAVHLHVELPRPSPADGRRVKDVNFPEEKVMEIQITTVMMHAWSEVEHNVIYKNPDRIVVDDTMTRMIDGMNGLAINSEIMLEELQNGLKIARQAAQALEIEPFATQDPARVLTVLEEGVEDDDAFSVHPEWRDVVTHIVRTEHPIMTERLWDCSTPAGLRKVVHALTTSAGGSRPGSDICHQILRHLVMLSYIGEYTNKYKYLRDPRFFDDSSKVAFRSLYRLLAIANAFTILVSFYGPAAIDQIEARFGERFPRPEIQLRLINAVTLGYPVQTDKDTMKSVFDFALEFEKYFALAVALADWWTTVEPIGVFPARHNAASISYESFQADYGKYQCVFISPEDNPGGPAQASRFFLSPGDTSEGSLRLRYMRDSEMKHVLSRMYESWDWNGLHTVLKRDFPMIDTDPIRSPVSLPS